KSAGYAFHVLKLIPLIYITITSGSVAIGVVHIEQGSFLNKNWFQVFYWHYMRMGHLLSTDIM
ncbi:MAG: hypothetical protein ACLUOI_26070, partial [Eisenbergiella sp.]